MVKKKDNTGLILGIGAAALGLALLFGGRGAKADAVEGLGAFGGTEDPLVPGGAGGKTGGDTFNIFIDGDGGFQDQVFQDQGFQQDTIFDLTGAAPTAPLAPTPTEIALGQSLPADLRNLTVTENILGQSFPADLRDLTPEEIEAGQSIPPEFRKRAASEGIQDPKGLFAGRTTAGKILSGGLVGASLIPVVGLVPGVIADVRGGERVGTATAANIAGDLASVPGAIAGTFVAPGVGTVIGAGAGQIATEAAVFRVTRNKAEAQKAKQSRQTQRQAVQQSRQTQRQAVKKAPTRQAKKEIKKTGRQTRRSIRRSGRRSRRRG